MYGITPLILIALPLIFQILFGTKSTKYKFGKICLISIISQTLLVSIAYIIASYNFEKHLGGHPQKCGMGLLGFSCFHQYFAFF